LASSIAEIRLLHPIVVHPDGKLIAGRRRLEAFKTLGRDDIPATVLDIAAISAASSPRTWRGWTSASPSL
jgi:ParB-like chromosome segregation protein Spo0J